VAVRGDQEVGRQVIVGFDALGSGLPVNHEDHAEDVGQQGGGGGI